jgi:hypothetical protein
MRFNQRNTALSFLDQVSEKDFTFERRDWHQVRRELLVKETVEGIRNYAHLFKKSVRYITTPFYEAFLNNAAKMVPVLLDSDLGQQSGTYIYSRYGGTVTTFYSFNHHVEAGKIDVTIIEFFTDDQGTTLESCIQILGERVVVAFSSRQEEAGATHVLKVSNIIGITAFLQYCDIDVKELKPKEKHRQQSCRYFNETQSNIQIIDCTWFTTLIKSDGFPVQAHLHWYWVSDGRGGKKRKLNFLDTYKKSGYTKKAKALNQNI